MDDFIPVEHLAYHKELTTCLPYAESELRTKISLAVGAASACWDNLSGAGVFESERASQIAKDLCEEVIAITKMGKPSLGCATTAQLLEELRARVETGHGGLDYKTVDG